MAFESVVMQPSLSRQLESLKPGDHLCSISERPMELTAQVAPYLAEGLRQQRRCLYLTSAAQRTNTFQFCTSNDVDLERAVQRGTIQLLNDRDGYLTGGKFSPKKLRDLLLQFEAEAIAAGFTGLQFLGDMAWIMEPGVDSELLVEFESFLNCGFESSRSTFLCQYDRSQFNSRLLEDALRTHSAVVLVDQIYPNPFFEPHLNRNCEVSEVERLNRKLARLRSSVEPNRFTLHDHELLKAAVNGSIDGLFIKDQQGRYLLANPACAGFFGKSVEDLLGKTDVELFDPENVQAIAVVDEQVKSSGEQVTFEEQLEMAGRSQVYLTTKAPLLNAFGETAGIIGIARDISSRKRLESERELLTKRMRLQIDRMPLAYILTDSKFRVLDWNPAAETIFGYTKEEALGQISTELIVRMPFNEHLQDVLRRIENGDMDVHSINENQTKDGRTITCEWFNTPVIEPDGSFNGLITLAQDITDRQQKDDLLEQSRRRLEASFQNALDSIILFDNDTQFLNANPAACSLLGYRRDELLKMSARDVTPVEFHARIPEIISLLLSKGSTSGDFVLITKTSTLIDVEFRAAAQILPGVHQVFFRDVTERRRSEKVSDEYVVHLQSLSRRIIEIQEAERRHLARELHDEIGQALSAISVNLQSAQTVNGAITRPWLADSIRIIGHAISQVRSQSFNLRPMMLDDLGLISTLRWYADQQSQRAGFKLHFIAESSGSSLPSEIAIACYRIVQEALTNVIRHAQADQVWLEVREDGSTIELVIRDDGVGFDASLVRCRATQQAGFGVLGMQERVELLGGAIEIKSQPSVGTSISVQFDVTSQAPIASSSSNAERFRSKT